jgi:hypothetical protein
MTKPMRMIATMTAPTTVTVLAASTVTPARIEFI